MKQKLSISIDEETIKRMEETIKNGQFRNKSHAVEFTFNKFLESKE